MKLKMVIDYWVIFFTVMLGRPILGQFFGITNLLFNLIVLVGVAIFITYFIGKITYINTKNISKLVGVLCYVGAPIVYGIIATIFDFS